MVAVLLAPLVRGASSPGPAGVYLFRLWAEAPVRRACCRSRNLVWRVWSMGGHPY